jgi:hypothetical protein
MKPTWKHFAFLSIGVVAGALLLQGLVQAVLITPLVNLWWRIGYWLKFPSQYIYWLILISLVITAGITTLARSIRLSLVNSGKKKSAKTPVILLAEGIARTRQPNRYFKWVIARRLADVSRAVISHQENYAVYPRQTLEGRNWHPPHNIQKYLSIGLESSFQGSRHRGRRLTYNIDPIYDIDLEPVVAYLESRLEDDHA